MRLLACLSQRTRGTPWIAGKWIHDCLGGGRHPRPESLVLRTAQGWSSLESQTVKNPPAMQETWVRSLSWEEPLEKGMATHSSVLAWRITWTEEPGRLRSIGSQRVGHDWTTNTLEIYSHFLFSSRRWHWYFVLIVGLIQGKGNGTPFLCRRACGIGTIMVTNFENIMSPNWTFIDLLNIN